MPKPTCEMVTPPGPSDWDTGDIGTLGPDTVSGHHLGSSECPGGRQGLPRQAPPEPQANLLILFSLGWEVRLLVLFGVPRPPHHNTIPSALPAGWRRHPFS